MPFIFALVILLFVLLANFLLRSIDKFLGKGLDMGILIEFLFLNLAWILALAVPMAVLIATLMAFGRLSADNEVVAMRASGISYRSLLFPSIVFGLVVTALMIFFNNWVLPDMNHRARLLSSDISRKRPDLEFEVGYFIDALPENTILIGGRDGNIFRDINIFSKGERVAQRTVIADSGTVETIDDGVILHLSDGIIHELGSNNDEYREIRFKKYQVVIPVDNMLLTRRESSIRGDREMTYGMMEKKIINYRKKIGEVWERIDTRLNNEADLNILHQHQSETVRLQLETFKLTMTDSLSNMEDETLLLKFKRRFKNLQRGINSDFRLIGSYQRYIYKYKVELYKKFSIPFASIVFILIGAPLGIMTRRGGFAMSMAVSLGFFIIYWAFLIAGEELADRMLLAPFLAMWLPNILLGIVGLYLCYITSREQKLINLEIFNIFKRNRNKNGLVLPS